MFGYQPLFSFVGLGQKNCVVALISTFLSRRFLITYDALVFSCYETSEHFIFVSCNLYIYTTLYYLFPSSPFVVS